MLFQRRQFANPLRAVPRLDTIDRPDSKEKLHDAGALAAQEASADDCTFNSGQA
jgi:hypothetical protein